MSSRQIDVSIEHKHADPERRDGAGHPNTCPSCGSHYRDDELAEHLRVCPQCGYHFPVRAPDRIGQLADAGTFDEEDGELRSADPLDFFDLKPYKERLAEAEVGTGLGDAILTGRVAIDGHPCRIAAMDFSFMFDLDPSEGSGFEEVIEVARLVRQALEVLELESVPKTSGSRGIHVLVPISRRHDFAEVREFAGIVASALARAHPGLVTTEWTKAKRKGVLVDANQNGPGKTTASVYSVRPRAGAPVSTPLRWDEVKDGLDTAAFTMDVVLERVAREGDLFARVLEGGQSLGAALRALR